jgi:hypothetical protein
MSLWVFCEFLLNEKSELKFFRLKRSALKGESSGVIVILCLIRELRPFKCFFWVQIRWKVGVHDFFEKKFVADSNEIVKRAF